MGNALSPTVTQANGESSTEEVEEPKSKLLPLGERLVDPSQKPWPERRPLVPDKPCESFPAGRVPREVWDLVLCHVPALSDAVAFGRVCPLFASVLRTSRAWPQLLDGQHGEGMSTVLAQSRAVLEAVQSKRAIHSAELEEAKERFYRRARLELIRLQLVKQFGELHSVPDVAGCSDPSQLFWGATVFQLPSSSTPVAAVVVCGKRGALEGLAFLEDKAVFWRGLPVLPFAVFRDRCVNVTVRLYCRRESLILSASAEWPIAEVRQSGFA